MLHPDQPVHSEHVLPIVVGAHLRAELGDRRKAEHIRDAIESWMKQHELEGPPWPLVCTDLWYLNQVELKAQPTICVGQPEVNAAVAALSAQLPTVEIVDDSYRIQLDPEHLDLKCCLWGVDEKQTQKCVEVFIQAFLPYWLGSFFGVTVEK